MNWFVYIINTRHNLLYTGITTDVRRRFAEHQAQGPKCAKSLRGKAPLKVVFQKMVGSKSDALKIEYKIKQLSKLDKEALILSQKLPDFFKS